MSTPSIPPHPPSTPRYIVALPTPYIEPPSTTDEMRARLVAHLDEMLAHIHDPLPEGEPDWDTRELFPPDRAR